MATPFISTLFEDLVDSNVTSSVDDINDTLYSDMDDGGTIYYVAFLSSVVLVGAIGFLANALVCVALFSRAKHICHTRNILLVALVCNDSLASFSVVLNYSLRLGLFGVDLTGAWGSVLCKVFFSDIFLYILGNTALGFIGIIAFERYVKIVHSVKHRNYFKRWMLFVGIAFAILQGLFINLPNFWTYYIQDGECTQVIPDEVTKKSYALLVVIWTYVMPLCVYVYCYGQIIIFIRKRAKVAAINPIGCQSTSVHAHSGNIDKSQFNTIKTMTIISTVYVMTGFLSEFLYVAWAFDMPLGSDLNAYYVSVILIYVNPCVNPFIYATVHDEVREQTIKFLRFLCRRKTRENNRQTIATISIKSV